MRWAVPTSYPEWVCDRVVYCVFWLSMTQGDAANLVGVHRNTVVRIMRRFKAGASLAAPSRVGTQYRRPVMDAAMTAELLRIIRLEDDLYLDEIADKLGRLHNGRALSISTVCRALQANGWTRKKVLNRRLLLPGGV